MTQRKQKEFVYLSQLDRGDKFYKWKLGNFVIAIVPLLVSALFKSGWGLIFSIVFLVTTLVLTFEVYPEEHLMNYLKVRVIYMFKRKVDVNQQVYSQNRLMQISNQIKFGKIYEHHITLSKGGYAVLFEYQQLNPDLMSDYEIEIATKQKAAFLSNFPKLKEMVVELSQSYDDVIAYNKELLKTAPPHLHTWIEKRIAYIERSSRSNKEDEKTTILYLENKDDDINQFIRDVERLGIENNVSLHILQGDKLKRVIASIIADVRYNDIYPENTAQALEMED
ncbi:---NA--- [Erysipelothrix amsterdamensis]|uniref:---NA n=1 Tax=Erysipelothrix amsterdamensis TaxID=2929157 RepID=A0AAU9VIV6_9FIRM|nr:hypothetical protein ERYAMS_00727 [Erysipelothrix sp. A18Y020d]CAH2762066.1 ---NA--- [Erysipelothrix sp. A18Y020d]